MTADEWVQMLNQLVSKTRDGRIDWRTDSQGNRSQANVGAYIAALDYVVVRSNQRLLPQRGSLALSLFTSDGRRIVTLTEAECAASPGQADDIALRTLFEAVVVEPHTKAIEGFRSALSDL